MIKEFIGSFDYQPIDAWIFIYWEKLTTGINYEMTCCTFLFIMKYKKTEISSYYVGIVKLINI